MAANLTEDRGVGGVKGEFGGKRIFSTVECLDTLTDGQTGRGWAVAEILSEEEKPQSKTGRRGGQLGGG